MRCWRLLLVFGPLWYRLAGLPCSEPGVEGAPCLGLKRSLPNLLDLYVRQQSRWDGHVRSSAYLKEIPY